MTARVELLIYQRVIPSHRPESSAFLMPEQLFPFRFSEPAAERPRPIWRFCGVRMFHLSQPHACIHTYVRCRLMCIEIRFFYESSKEISPINFNHQFCCFCSGRRTSKRIYTNSALASGTATGVRLIPDTNAGWIVRKEHPEIYVVRFVDIPWFITCTIDISWYIHHKSFLAIAWLHTNIYQLTDHSKGTF